MSINSESSSKAKETKVITKKNGVYMYGEDTILGASDSVVINWLKEPKNSKITAMIREEAFADEFGGSSN